MSAPREIMLVDMDAFFASVEMMMRPSLRGLPVVVVGGAGERAVVSAASYEAKRFGIHGGMPAREAARLCPEARFVQADLDKYVYISGRLVEVYERYSPTVEPASIDEAYLDITGEGRLFGSSEALAKRLKAEIESEFGLGVSVGIAPNKTWAKIACEFGKPNGLTIIDESRIPELAKGLPARDMPGVGEKTAQILDRLGIGTIADLAETAPSRLFALFGKSGPSLCLLAQGRDSSPVVHWRMLPKPKSIGHEFTFPADICGRERLLGALAWLTEIVVNRLRSMNAIARTVQLKIRYSDFTTFVRRRTEGEINLVRQAYKALETLFLANVPADASVRQIGVAFSNLLYPENTLPELPGLFNHSKNSAAENSLDCIRQRWGADSIHWGRSAKWLAHNRH